MRALIRRGAAATIPRSFAAAMTTIKSILALGLVAVVLARPQGTTYTTKYDNIDIENIIKNERLLNNYVGCLLDKNPCSPEGSELKSKFFLFTSQTLEKELLAL